jgi:hypothetical protein
MDQNTLNVRMLLRSPGFLTKWLDGGGGAVNVCLLRTMKPEEPLPCTTVPINRVRCSEVTVVRDAWLLA